jgi:hypothetical protein
VSHADSILRQIDRQRRALRTFEAGLRDAPSTPGDHTWNAREILLHLIGVTRQIPDDLMDAGSSVEARQPGGTYFDISEVRTASDAGAVLVRQLDRVADTVRRLDDDALSRTVKITNRDGLMAADVPIGLVVHHALTQHFDEHLAQLRDALEA